MIKFKQFHWLWLTAFLFACSCSTFTVETVEDGIAQSHAEVQAVYDTIGSLKTQGVITAQARDEYVKSVQIAEQALVQARTLLQLGDPAGAASNLGIAKNILVATISALEDET